MESVYRLHGAEIIDSMFLTVKQINNMKRENFIVSIPKPMKILLPNDNFPMDEFKSFAGVCYI